MSESVSDGDVYRHGHRRIFRASYKLAEANQPIDVVTRPEQLEQERRLTEVGGLADLGAPAQHLTSVANV
ncbi:DnaB-like helicase N-terminal domain-containing protein, partial [Pseudomonas aeruginosa]